MFDETYYKDLEGIDITNLEEDELYTAAQVPGFDAEDKNLYIFTPKGIPQGKGETFSESDIKLEGEESAKKGKSCLYCK